MSDKKPVGEDPYAQPDIQNLPPGVVALMVWRENCGPEPMTVLISRSSWEMNQRRLMNDGQQFHLESTYEFESPVAPTGRRTIFHISRITAWAANVHVRV